MTVPVRLQLSRRKGFDLQASSLATNGLTAIVVARPSRWGNPYKIAPVYRDAFCNLPEVTPESAVAAYREHLERSAAQWPSMREALGGLRGRNLACWCAHGAPCHADVLLEVANVRRSCDLASSQPGETT